MAADLHICCFYGHYYRDPRLAAAHTATTPTSSAHRTGHEAYRARQGVSPRRNRRRITPPLSTSAGGSRGPDQSPGAATPS